MRERQEEAGEEKRREGQQIEVKEMEGWKPGGIKTDRGLNE